MRTADCENFEDTVSWGRTHRQSESNEESDGGKVNEKVDSGKTLGLQQKAERRQTAAG